MDTEGEFTPASADAARERYAALGGTAQVVVREVAKAMAMDADEYDRRVTGEVVETARDALFAELLAVRVGTREEFDDWVAAHPGYDVREAGSENVDSVAWHAAPATETVVAATFHDERRAAVSTLRRQAFGRVYRPLVSEGSGGAEAEPDAQSDSSTETDGE